MIIGHRGCAGIEPENTLRAFRRALALGVDAIEMDIRLSRDGVPVVIHDATVNRMTNGRGRVRSYFAEELRQFAARKGEQIPTLDEVISEVLPNKSHRVSRLVVELKEADTAEPVVALVRRHKIEKQALLIAFCYDTLKEVRRLNSAIPIGTLWNRPPKNAIRLSVAILAEAIFVNHRHATASIVSRAHKAGLRLYVWTVNTSPVFRRMIQLGVDGIATDYPDLLRKFLCDGSLQQEVKMAHCNKR